MKKTLIITGIIFSALNITSLSFAEVHSMGIMEHTKTITGSVESVNTGNNTIVLKDKDVPHYFVLGVSQGDIASLNKGDLVQATVNCVGSNLVLGIKK